MNRPHSTFWQRLKAAAARQPLVGGLILIILCITALFGSTRLSLQSNVDMLMAGDTVTRQAYLHITREFGSDNRSFLYVQDEALWTPDKLRALAQLNAQLRQLPFIERIDDLFSTPVVQSLDGQLTARPILVDAPGDQPGADLARTAALENRHATRQLVSADGQAIAIGLSIREALPGSEAPAVHEALETLIAETRKVIPSIVQVGPAQIQAEIRQGIVRDLTWLAPLSLLGLLVMSLLGGGRIASLILSLAGVTASLIMTAGFMGLSGIPVSFMTILLLPVTVLSCSLLANLADGTRDAQTATPLSPRVIAMLVLLSGFASLSFSEIIALRDFGLVTTFALLASVVVVLLLKLSLAPMLEKWALATVDRSSVGISAGIARLLLGQLPSRLLLGSLLLGALTSAALLLSPTPFRSSHAPIAHFAENSALVRAAEGLHQQLAGIHVFYITLDAHAEGAFRTPENLQRLVDIQSFIAREAVFDDSRSLADLVAQANSEANGRRADAFQIPATRQQVNQYLLLHRPKDLHHYVSHDFRHATIEVRHNLNDAARLNRLIGELRTVVDHSAGPAMTTAITGFGPLIATASEQLLSQLALTLAVLLAVVLMAVALTFTTFKGGLIAALISSIPPLILFGIMLAGNIPVSMLTLALLIVTVALSAQGSCQLFERYRQRCHDSQLEAAAVLAVQESAGPLIALSLGLCASFGALLLSGIEPVRHFALLAGAAVLLPALVNLVITPRLLVRIPIVSLYELLSLSMQREALEKSPLFAGLSFYQIRKII
jgi:uncharacterized protein